MSKYVRDTIPLSMTELLDDAHRHYHREMCRRCIDTFLPYLMNMLDLNCHGMISVLHFDDYLPAHVNKEEYNKVAWQLFTPFNNDGPIPIPLHYFIVYNNEKMVEWIKDGSLPIGSIWDTRFFIEILTGLVHELTHIKCRQENIFSLRRPEHNEDEEEELCLENERKFKVSLVYELSHIYEMLELFVLNYTAMPYKSNRFDVFRIYNISPITRDLSDDDYLNKKKE